MATKSVTCIGSVTPLSVSGKVLASILHDRVSQKLLTHHRHEHSGFTPNKSTVDRILAHRILTERLHERSALGCWQPMCKPRTPSYLRKAFDSVNWDVSWRISALRKHPQSSSTEMRPVFSYREHVMLPSLTTPQLILGYVMGGFSLRHSSNLNHVLGRMSEKSGWGA